MKRLLLFAALLLFAVAAWAGVYRWVDAKGVVHYSDEPPPQGAQSLDIETSPTDSAAVAKRKQALQEKIDAHREQDQARAAAAARAEQEQQRREAACDKARARVKKLVGVDKVLRHAPDGSTTYLSGRDLTAYKTKARAKAQKLCENQT